MSRLRLRMRSRKWRTGGRFACYHHPVRTRRRAMPDPVEVVPDPPRLPRRAPDGHKGTYGRVLVVAGGRGMSGAAVLAGRAALRGGAGLVQVATPADVHPVVAAGDPCYLTAALPLHADGTYSESS